MHERALQRACFCGLREAQLAGFGVLLVFVVDGFCFLLGKSGSVLMSLPTRADVSVNCVPANCMPSPLSPQKRIVTEGKVVSGLLFERTAPLTPLAPSDAG